MTPSPPPHPPAVVLGYSNMDESDLRAAAALLGRAWEVRG